VQAVPPHISPSSLFEALDVNAHREKVPEKARPFVSVSKTVIVERKQAEGR